MQPAAVTLPGRHHISKPVAVKAPAARRRCLRVQAGIGVRPYTVRKGDTVDSIATKRGFKVNDIKKLNSDIDLNKLPEGTTILIPANKLSARDLEILEGIGPRSYRLYPVRKGEKLADIMTKRGILRSEMEQLNPGTNLDRLKEHQMLKLPANKFTKREKEMLTGSGLVPPEFFASGKAYLGFGFVIGVAVSAVVAYWTRLSKKEDLQ